MSTSGSLTLEFVLIRSGGSSVGARHEQLARDSLRTELELRG